MEEIKKLEIEVNRALEEYERLKIKREEAKELASKAYFNIRALEAKLREAKKPPRKMITYSTLTKEEIEYFLDKKNVDYSKLFDFIIVLQNRDTSKAKDRNKKLDKEMIIQLFVKAEITQRSLCVFLGRFNGDTYKTIGDFLGFSVERGRQLYSSIDKKLKHPRVFRHIYDAYFRAID